MCGIFGLIFHSDRHLAQPQRAIELFNSLAEESVQRGYDATGMGIVRADSITHHYRGLGPSWNVVPSPLWRRAVAGVQSPALAIMGHTRWGTHGGNTLENAHPFLWKAADRPVFIGTHNGQVHNYRTFGPTPAFENDSRNLLYGMSRRPMERWAKLLEQVRGSFALVWAVPGQVMLARNLLSPCVYGYCAELDATVYASTRAILMNALGDTFTLREMQDLPVGEIHTFVPGCAQPSIHPFQTSRRDSFLQRWQSPACDTCKTPCRKLTKLTGWGDICGACMDSIEARGVPHNGVYEQCFLCRAYYRVGSPFLQWTERFQSYTCARCVVKDAKAIHSLAKAK